MDKKVFLLYLTFRQDLDVLNMVMIGTTIFETKAETSGKVVRLVDWGDMQFSIRQKLYGTGLSLLSFEKVPRSSCLNPPAPGYSF